MWNRVQNWLKQNVLFFFYWTGLQDPCELCISQDLQGYRSFKSSWWQKWRWLGTRCRCTRVCPVSTLAPSLLPRIKSLKKLFVLLEEACTIHLCKETWDGEAGCGRDDGGCGLWSVGAVDVRWVWISSWPTRTTTTEAAAWPRVAQMEAPPAPGSPPVEPRVPGGGQSE